MQTIIYILPELFLSLSIMLILMVGVFVKNSFKIVNLLTILTLIFAIGLVLSQSGEITKIFNQNVITNAFDKSFKIGTILNKKGLNPNKIIKVKKTKTII